MRGAKINAFDCQDDGTGLGPFSKGTRCDDGTLSGMFADAAVWASGVWDTGVWDQRVWSERVW